MAVQAMLPLFNSQERKFAAVQTYSVDSEFYNKLDSLCRFQPHAIVSTVSRTNMVTNVNIQALVN